MTLLTNSAKINNSAFNMYRLLILLVTSVLIGCSSTPDYNVVHTSAEKPYWEENVNTSNEQAVGISYKRDSSGNKITHRVKKDVVVFGTEHESLSVLKRRARGKAVTEATEEINGVIIKATTQVDSMRYSFDDSSKTQQFSHQELNETAIQETAGIATVHNMKCKTEPTNADLIKLACVMDVHVPEIDKVSLN